MALKPILLVTVQRHEGDCAIACLASVLRVPYEEVLAVAAQINQTVLVDGLDNAEMISIARRFNQTLVERAYSEINWRRDVGILGGRCKTNTKGEHAVVLSHGLIFDPDSLGEVWRAKDYIKKHGMTGIDFLELED